MFDLRSLLATGFLAALASAAHAVTVTLADHDSAGLVAAVTQANQTHLPLRIELAPHGLYVLKDCAEPRLHLGLPQVRGAVTIVGNGAEIRRYADSEFALLGVADSGRLALENLTLAEGAGGALVNRGIVHLDGVRITDSSGSDAAVRNYGTLRGVDSLIGYNAVMGATRDAGVVLNYGQISLVRTRFVGNRIGGHANAISASALLNLGTARLRDVTVEGNSALDVEPGNHALINLGNGQLESERVVSRDNWPDNWPGEVTAVRVADVPAE